MRISNNSTPIIPKDNDFIEDPVQQANTRGSAASDNRGGAGAEKSGGGFVNNSPNRILEDRNGDRSNIIEANEPRVNDSEPRMNDSEPGVSDSTVSDEAAQTRNTNPPITSYYQRVDLGSHPDGSVLQGDGNIIVSGSGDYETSVSGSKNTILHTHTSSNGERASINVSDGNNTKVDASEGGPVAVTVEAKSVSFFNGVAGDIFGASVPGVLQSRPEVVDHSTGYRRTPDSIETDYFGNETGAVIVGSQFSDSLSFSGYGGIIKAGDGNDQIQLTDANSVWVEAGKGQNEITLNDSSDVVIHATDGGNTVNLNNVNKAEVFLKGNGNEVFVDSSKAFSIRTENDAGGGDTVTLKNTSTDVDIKNGEVFSLDEVAYISQRGDGDDTVNIDRSGGPVVAWVEQGGGDDIIKISGDYNPETTTFSLELEPIEYSVFGKAIDGFFQHDLPDMPVLRIYEDGELQVKLYIGTQNAGGRHAMTETIQFDSGHRFERQGNHFGYSFTSP